MLSSKLPDNIGKNSHFTSQNKGVAVLTQSFNLFVVVNDFGLSSDSTKSENNIYKLSDRGRRRIMVCFLENCFQQLSLVALERTASVPRQSGLSDGKVKIL